ncbi:putative oxidoreductase [Gordonia effusa NBRC 100432]|uniref:Putative oxidoreductase n=1 Tax=Gordonia effusa NBRC 100432 TaxID=1077974 RepID=H0QYT6_9ACTN|nr:SDR family NAD(P)-dependent oxidoreductase [Gordonia effusa]GAB17987.1 putative oxidoreductase [Gordonia effusa NBRC 100432]
MDVAGKVAIVTGGAGGIGAAIARRLVSDGAKALIVDLDAARVRATADEINAAQPDSATSAAGDASDSATIADWIALAESAFGPVDMYFANAGIGGAPGLDLSDDQWAQVIDVNLLAHVRAARALVPSWEERGEGYFVSTASAAGLLTQIGSAGYSVTKHAAVGFAEWLSITYGDKGIRVSCLCPMGVDTKLLHPDEGAEDGIGKLMQSAVETAGRVLSPAQVADDVAAAIADERFLILPHPEVLDMYRHKGSDYDRWLSGMRRYQQTLLGSSEPI